MPCDRVDLLSGYISVLCPMFAESENPLQGSQKMNELEFSNNVSQPSSRGQESVYHVHEFGNWLITLWAH